MDPEDEKTVFDTISFDNGDYYEGQTLDRIPHGEGTMYYDNGETVTCRWVYGEPTRGKRDGKIPGEGAERDRVYTNGHTLYVGYGYTNDTISEAFQINSFIRGIRTHRDVAVLFSTGDSVYMDGKGWEPDNDREPVFSYTGEGLRGDQAMKSGNLFLKNSVGKKVYLFVRRRSNEYVFHGQVIVKRVEKAREDDADGRDRMVYRFILSKV